MYKCNLSFKQLKLYLNFLTNLGFLKVVDKGLYQTTEKGLQFIEVYDTLEHLLNMKPEEPSKTWVLLSLCYGQKTY